MPRKQDLGPSLQALAKTIIRDALEPDVPLQTRLECLKVTGGFWLGQNKIKLKAPDEEEPATAFTFKNAKDLINGAGKVPNG